MAASSGRPRNRAPGGRGGFGHEGDRGAQVHEQFQQHDVDRGERRGPAGGQRHQHGGDQGELGAEVETHRAAELGGDVAALGDGGGYGGVGVVGEHQPGGLAGQVRTAAAHGDPDVGGGQRGSVVDAVAGDGHHLAAALQGTDDPQLAGWGGAGHHGTVGQLAGQGLLTQGGELAAVQLRAGREPGLDGDGGRGGRVIPGDHDGGHPGGSQVGDRAGDPGAERVGERGQPGEFQLVLRGLAVGGDLVQARWANPITRSPPAASWAACASARRRPSDGSAQRASTVSRALDTASSRPSPVRQARLASLRAGSNGNAATCSPGWPIPLAAAAAASSVSTGSRACPVPPGGWQASAVASTTSRSPWIPASWSRLRVRVPVLSVTTTVTEPSASPARSRRSSAPRRASWRPSTASSTVTRMGSSSGTVAKAIVSPSSSISCQLRPVSSPATGTTMLAATAKTSTTLASWASDRCSGVGGSFSWRTSLPSWPSSVRGPVATTTAAPSPAATAVPAYSTAARSASGAATGTGAGPLPAGSASPVRVDSSTRSPSAAITRASAGTRSPASITNTSPGTSSAAGISATAPPHRMQAAGAASWRSASIALAARSSVTASVMTTKAITTKMAMASSRCPNTDDSTPTTSSSSCSGSVAAFSSSSRTESFFGAAGALGPYRASRRARSPAGSPAALASSRSRTAAASTACQSGWLGRLASRPPPGAVLSAISAARLLRDARRYSAAPRRPGGSAGLGGGSGRRCQRRGRLGGQRFLLKRRQLGCRRADCCAGLVTQRGAEVVPPFDLGQPGPEPVQVGLGFLDLGVGHPALGPLAGQLR